MRAPTLLLCIVFSATLPGCVDPVGGAEPDTPRTFGMGFSALGPVPGAASAIAAIEMWSGRADAALMPLTVPWEALLDGADAAAHVRAEHLPLAEHYRGMGLSLVAWIEPAHGLRRDLEAPPLTERGRSVVEPEIQALYREYVSAVDSIVRPGHLGLLVETNLIRRIAPEQVYTGLRTMANEAAARLRGDGSEATLFIVVQVEEAWGRFLEDRPYRGIDSDLEDFPFAEALGLSVYPYFGWETPEAVPDDYFTRLDARLPMLVVEGGWPSAAIPGLASSPALQRRWIERLVDLADITGLHALFQVTFTDLDVEAWNLPPGGSLEPFAVLGLADTRLRPKPALQAWDAAFARPRAPDGGG